MKRSHSIHMLSIQIDTKSFELVKSKLSHSIHMSSIQIDTKNFELVKSKLIGQIKIESFHWHVEHSNWY